MITHSDEGPDFDPDDELAVVLRPPAEFLGAPPGHYEAIRRGASRRKLLRTAVGAAAVTCAVAAVVILPLRLTSSGTPTTPTVPMAPPSPTVPAPDRSATTVPSPVPTKASEAVSSTPTSRAGRPTASPSDAFSAQDPSMVPSVARTER